MLNRSKFRAAALLLISAVFVSNLYRAWTQSITIDEAQTFIVLVHGPAARMFTAYDANHHVLHTYLCRLTVALLGASEFSLRLPSLLGGLLYLVMAYRLCMWLFGETLASLLTMGMLVLNPLIMDHLSVARGYGLGLGLCLWGLHELIRYAENQQPRLLRRAGAAFGLSVSANLTYLFPAAAIGAAFLVILAREHRLRAGLLHFAAPAAGIAALFVIPPVSTATSTTFYVGAGSWSECLERIFRDSFFSAVRDWLSILYSPQLVTWAARLAMPLVVLGAALMGAAAGWRWWRERSGARLDASARFAYLAGAGMALTAAANTALHHTVQVPYPEPRAALYWVVFSTMALPLLAARMRSRFLRWPVYGLIGVCALLFALEWNVTDYREWRFDRNSKRIVAIIENREAHTGRPMIRVGATWILAPALNFYRITHRLDWMQEVDRGGPDGRYDYYVLWGDERALAGKLKLEPLFKDELAGVMLAVPGG